MNLGTAALENRVNVVLDRDNGIPYADVLARYDISPNQFARTVIRNLDDLVQSTRGRRKQQLKRIISDDKRRIELFNMGEDFIKKQYDRVIAEEQSNFYEGTLKHPENINNMVYCAFVSDNPKLKSKNRKKVIKEIQNLPDNLAKHLHNLKLYGLMTNQSGINDSPLTVLELFDTVYQRKSQDDSIFDLTQKEHMHKWESAGRASNLYWKNTDNIEEAIYHTLTENHPSLASKNRKEIIETIKNLPSTLGDYFHGLGLCGLMMNAFEGEERDSPSAVFEVFDRVYQRKTGNQSLDLKFDGNNRLIRK